MFNLDLRSFMHLATARLSVNTLDQASLSIINNFITLLNAKAGHSVLYNFNQNQD